MKDVKKLRNDDISFYNSADGLWDIGLGLCLMMLGITFIADIAVYTAVFYFLVFLTIRALKKRVTYPRIGYVNHKAQKDAVNKILIALAGLGILCMILMVLFLVTVRGGGETKDTVITVLLIAVTLAVPALVLLTGIIFKIKRFAPYAAALLVLLVAAWFIDWAYARQIALAVVGAAMLSVGMVKLFSFMRIYPKLDEGSGDEE